MVAWVFSAFGLTVGPRRSRGECSMGIQLVRPLLASLLDLGIDSSYSPDGLKM